MPGPARAAYPVRVAGDEVGATVERAVRLLSLGRADEAIRTLGPVVAAHPEQTRPSAVLAVALLQQQRAGEAADLLARVIAANPEAAEPHRLMSIALRLLRRPHEAVGAAYRAAVLDPHDVDHRVELAETYLATRQLAPAREAAQQAVAMAPESAASHLIMADVLFPEFVKPRKADLVGAQWHVRRALELEPGNVYARNELARIMMADGRALEAAGVLSAAVGDDPDEQALHINLDLVFGTVVRWAHWGMIALCVSVVVIGLVGYGVAQRTDSLAVHITTSLAALTVVVGAAGWLTRSVRRRVPDHLLRPLLRGFARRDKLGALWAGFMTLQWLGLLVGSCLPPMGVLLAGVAGFHTLWIGVALSWLRFFVYRPRLS